ncbi:MAG: DUF934 domain-containing protein [Myxococcota bacterium]
MARKIIQLADAPTVVEDSFQRVDDDAALPDGDVLVSLARFLSEGDALRARRGNVGVVVPGHTELEALRPILDEVSLLALEFPKFTDGRGYSTARLLRENAGYSGELRAVGDVLRDQLFYMARCGFNSFALREDQNLDEALIALEEFSVTYQAAVDEARPIYRRAADEAESSTEQDDARS